jgi:hypothetical protein
MRLPKRMHKRPFTATWLIAGIFGLYTKAKLEKRLRDFKQICCIFEKAHVTWKKVFNVAAHEEFDLSESNGGSVRRPYRKPKREANLGVPASYVNRLL